MQLIVYSSEECRKEIERLRAALTEMETMHETIETENNERGREIERTRHLAGALLDRVMELDPSATAWRESLVERWPWLEGSRDAADEINRLQSLLDEITDAHRVVMDEKCHADERHCTCVPVLRKENERLQSRLTVAEADLAALREWLAGAVERAAIVVEDKAAKAAGGEG